MALSMDEQRILAEIERRLSADDPRLASSLTTFRRPGPGTVLRSPRARIIGSLFTVLLVAMVSLMVYAMIPFRTHPVRNDLSPSSAPPANTAFSAASTGQPATQRTSTDAATSASPSTGVSSTGHSTTPRASGTASGKTRAAAVKTTSAAESPVGNP